MPSRSARAGADGPAPRRLAGRSGEESHAAVPVPGRTSLRVASGRSLVADDVGSAAAVLRRQGSHVLQLVPMADPGPRPEDRAGARRTELEFRSHHPRHPRLHHPAGGDDPGRHQPAAGDDGIGEQVTNVKFKRMIQEIKSDVESGKQFSEAIAKFPGCFNPLYVNMVRASEMSGSFAKMLDRIAAFMTQQMETRKMVVSASIYPGIIAIMAVSVTIFLLTFVLPRFAGVFEGKEDVLPWPTIFLMGLSSWMVEYWWAVLVGLLLGVVGFVAGGRTTSGRRWIDHGKLRMPLFRGMFRAPVRQPLAADDGRAAERGVPVLDSITVTADITGNVLPVPVARSAFVGEAGTEDPQRGWIAPRSCRRP